VDESRDLKDLNEFSKIIMLERCDERLALKGGSFLFLRKLQDVAERAPLQGGWGAKNLSKRAPLQGGWGA